MKTTADAVIVGGGIIGAACAYFLCQSGLEVHLLERDFPASGTSRACDGLVLLWDKQNPTELDLARQSLALWHQLDNDLDVDFGFERRGTILLAEEDEQMRAGLDKAQSLQKIGQKAEVLNSQDLQNLEPGLSADLSGGILFPDDLQVDPRRATLGMLSAAQHNGLRLHVRQEVIDIHHGSTGGRPEFNIITQDMEIVTPSMICAAGVWSNQLAQLLDLELPIQPRKGHILVTAQSPNLIRHSLLEGGYATTVGSAAQDTQVAFVAEITSQGRLMIGSSREFSGFDRTVSLPVIQAIASRANRFIPALANIAIIRSYAGLRPWSPDHLPLIGEVKRVPGFYLASGHEGAGIGLAPITGRLISDLITGANTHPIIEQISPNRFTNTANNEAKDT